MWLQGDKLLAVITAMLLTLASGTVPAYASTCIPAEKAVRYVCCPVDSHSVQADTCMMDECICRIQSRPNQQEDQPVLINSNAPSWNVQLTLDSAQPPTFNDLSFCSETIIIQRERGPPPEPDHSGNGLRAPPVRRA